MGWGDSRLGREGRKMGGLGGGNGNGKWEVRYMMGRWRRGFCGGLV